LGIRGSFPDFDRRAAQLVLIGVPLKSFSRLMINAP